MTPCVFDEFARTNATIIRHGEGSFEFLNRSASTYFGHVRDLVEEWFCQVPPAARASLRGALRAKDDRHAAAAFWELYLHEAYRRSGFEIDIHPEIPGCTKQPDFRLSRGGGPFYLEAVSVSRAQPEVGEDGRLAQVHRVLAEMKLENFRLDLTTYDVGPRSLATGRLRGDLHAWLAELDPDRVTPTALLAPHTGLENLPMIVWKGDGWTLVFRASPRPEWARGQPRSALWMRASGRPRTVDNVGGIRRVLSDKSGRYGRLDGPLVIAVQSNTRFPTQDYQVESALYGISSHFPAERAQHADDLFKDGFWIGRTGWCKSEVPQVLTIHGLLPETITRIQPRCWTTLEPRVLAPDQPDWLAPMIVQSQSRPGDAIPMAAHFGLADDWPGMVEPDFDLS